MKVPVDDFVKVDLDISEFLRNSECPVSGKFSEFDLDIAREYYGALGVMRCSAKKVEGDFDFPCVPTGDCFFVNPEGVASRRIVDFREIENFSKYVRKEYELWD